MSITHIGDDKAKLDIAYIGGGSRAWAWSLIRDLALEDKLCGTMRLYDIDKPAALRNQAIGNSLLERDDAPGKWQYVVADTLAEALTGADVVIISILPGTFDEMQSDVHAPEAYGIYQSVGDSTGPGGLIRALRTVPLIAEFARAIEQYAPEAWVINYTNPMAICVHTLYTVFPAIKAFGCCHEVFGAQHLMLRALEEIEGIQGVKKEEIFTNVLGINHFTWIDRADYKGHSIMDAYHKLALKYADEGIDPQDWGWYFSCTHRVKFDLYLRYGAAAAAGDRHLAEFVPGKWYLQNPDEVKKWGFRITPVSWRRGDLEEKLKQSHAMASGQQKLDLHPSGEEGVQMIKALMGLERLTTNVNLPNLGQMEGIPQGAVVETNAQFTRDRVMPVFSGVLPHGVQTWVLLHLQNQQGIIRAALNRDRRLAYDVFINDPLVQLGLADARCLFDQMIHNTRAYLSENLLV